MTDRGFCGNLRGMRELPCLAHAADAVLGKLSAGLLAVAIVAAASGCGGAGDETIKKPVAPSASRAPRAAPPTGPELLPAQVITQLEDEGTPWHFARGRAGGLALWTAKGRWWTRRIGDGGKADGEP